MIKLNAEITISLLKAIPKVMTRHVIDVIIGLGWIAFIIYWFIEATKAKKGTSLRSYGYFALYRLIIFIIIIAIISSSRHNGKYSYSNFEIHSTITRILGLIIFALGLSFAVWARIYLKENWGMPMSKIDKPNLIETGPYALVRHPIYTGMLAGMLGTALAVSLYWVLIVLAIGAYFIYSAKAEEKYMLKLFPKDYKAYKSKTKFILPYIY